MKMTNPPRDRSFFGLDEDGCGVPWEKFVVAVAVYIALHDNNLEACTIRRTAQAFHVTDAVIMAAKEDAPYLFTVGPDEDPTTIIIEMDRD